MYRKAFAFLLAAAPLAAAPLAAQTPVRAGETVNGTLGGDDPATEEGARYNRYVIQGQPGDRVLVRMRSEDFDTYLRWGREENGEWRETVVNDDAGEGTDSRLVVTLAGGGYELRAGAFGEGEGGAYVLELSTPAPLRAGRLRVGETVRGELTESDFEGEGGFEDHYTLGGGRAGDVVTVFAESEDLDPYVSAGAMNDGRFQESGSDDDGGVGTNAQLVTEIMEGGTLHVIVRAFSGGAEGAYTLRVQPGAAEPVVEDDEYEGEGEDFEGMGDEMADAVMTGTFVGPVQVNADVGGTLGDDPADESGMVQYYREYSVRAAAGEMLVIHVRAEDLDSFVRVGRGQGEAFESLGEDDDGGEDLDARLEFEAPEAGTYTIRVSSAFPGQAGPFVLRVERAQ